MDDVWIVASWPRKIKGPWQLQGIFATQAEAAAAAKRGEWYGPAPVGHRLPDDVASWPHIHRVGEGT